MNGPEHYREAERLLDVMATTDMTAATHLALAGAAQAHATLALAAATVDAQRQGSAVWSQWPEPTEADD